MKLFSIYDTCRLRCHSVFITLNVTLREKFLVLVIITIIMIAIMLVIITTYSILLLKNMYS